MSEGFDEVVYVLARLQAELEDLAVGGLRAAGPERLPVLESMREDLERAGAASLAARLSTLAAAIRANEREAAAALMRAQAGLRLFERLLTLEVATEWLEGLAASTDGGPEPEPVDTAEPGLAPSGSVGVEAAP